MTLQKIPGHSCLILAFALCTFSAQAGATDHDGWTGTVTVHTVGTFSINHTAEGGGKTAIHKETKDIRVFFHPGDVVSAEGSYYEEESTHVAYPTWSTDEHNIDIGKSAGQMDGDPVISLDADGHYLINVQQINVTMPGTRQGSFITHGGSTPPRRWNDKQNFIFSPTDITDLHSKSGDRHLDGTKTITEPGDDDGKTKYVSTIEWHLSFKEDLRLLVTIDHYDDWQPRGTTAEDHRGCTMHVHADLQTKDGKVSPEKADSFTFELIDTSAVPGTAINFPPATKGATAKKDLRFDAADNTGLTIQGDDGQMAQTTTAGQTSADATISCFDWGAYGKVRVCAQVGSRRIYGYLQAFPAMTDIRIPKRDEKSLIADAWKKANDIADGVADDDDSDDHPKSKVLDGDGLTLYEEYRGFYEKGEHKQGDPKTKDVFIRDKSNGKCQAGLDLLAKISGLSVHSKLTDEEFPADRVVNFNFDPAAHSVAQHGIILLASDAFGDSEAAGKGKLRCPADMARDLEIHAIDPAVRGKTSAAEEFNVTVAHELLHCLGVDHHGDSDPGVVEWQRKTEGHFWEYPFTTTTGPDGVTHTANGVGVPITIVDEHGNALTDAQITALLTFPLKIYVAAEKNGEHSGDVNCVMRYNCCNARIKGDKRILVRPMEPLGLTLCDNPKGTDFNADSTLGGSYHGNAANTRGDCKHQIVVNDKRAQ